MILTHFYRFFNYTTFYRFFNYTTFYSFFIILLFMLSIKKITNMMVTFVFFSFRPFSLSTFVLPSSRAVTTAASSAPFTLRFWFVTTTATVTSSTFRTTTTVNFTLFLQTTNLFSTVVHRKYRRTKFKVINLFHRTLNKIFVQTLAIIHSEVESVLKAPVKARNVSCLSGKNQRNIPVHKTLPLQQGVKRQWNDLN